MYQRKSAKKTIIAITLLCICVSYAGYLYIRYCVAEAGIYVNEQRLSAEAFDADIQPFINNPAGNTSDTYTGSLDNALYYFTAPEGFTFISNSRAWDSEMLELLYYELKENTHGEEIRKLREVIIHPHNDNDMNALATYSPGISSADLILNHPALPDDFRIKFPIYTGRITLYGGDNKTTVESMAGNLSHEYGHHYTFYYMFTGEMRRTGTLGTSLYSTLREAQMYNLIVSADIGEDYAEQRHRYIIETAAEDYVTLMGSITTRQVHDYYDVKQILEDPDLAGDAAGERNAFPQENMMLPLAIDVPGLPDYFYSYIRKKPPVPVMEKQQINLQIDETVETYNTETGLHSFTYYTITWNTPYPDTIYTLACYDPFEYSGWGTPIKTVRPGTRAMQTASAVVGNYVMVRDKMIHSLDDTLAQGTKIFYVVAQLPDGTYYISELFEYTF